MKRPVEPPVRTAPPVTQPAKAAGPAAPAKPVKPAKAARPAAPVKPAKPSRSTRTTEAEPLAQTAERTTPSRASADASASRPDPRAARTELRAARRERAKVERAEMRRFTRRSRHRRLAWLIGLGSVVVVAGGCVATAYSPLMAVQTIDVTGTKVVNAAQVRSALAGEVGRPLPLISQSAIKKSLAAFPLIRSYSVESHPPNTLVVSIVERTPIAVEKVGASYRVVDAAEVTMSTTNTRPPGYPLVVTTGSGGHEAAFRSAASVLQSLPSSVLSRVDTVTAASTDDVSFTLTDGGKKVVWGDSSNSALKAADLNALLAAEPSGVSTYDVSSPHTVTTR